MLIQHLRIRIGDGLDGPSPTSRDGIRITGDNGDTYNIVIDHCSVSWAIDENISFYNNTNTIYDVTISNTITSEALYDSLHTGGPHSMGMVLGGGAGQHDIALIKNLFAHNHDRNPLIYGPMVIFLANNLLYNLGWYGHVFSVHSPIEPIKATFVRSIYIAGADAHNDVLAIIGETTHDDSEFYYDDLICEDGTGAACVKNDKGSSVIVEHPRYG